MDPGYYAFPIEGLMPDQQSEIVVGNQLNIEYTHYLHDLMDNQTGQLNAKDMEIRTLRDALVEKEVQKDYAQAEMTYYKDLWLEQIKRADQLEKEVERLKGRTAFWVGQVAQPAPTLTSFSELPTSPTLPPPLKHRQYRKVIPHAQQVFTNSLEAASPVGSYEAALGRWGQWDEKDKMIWGIDIKDFLFHADGAPMVPQMVKKAPDSGVMLFKMKNPGVPNSIAEGHYKKLTRYEKKLLQNDAMFLVKWQNIMEEQGMVKVMEEEEYYGASGAKRGGGKRKRYD